MKPFIVFCHLPGHSLNADFDTFEQAFRVFHTHISQVMEEVIDFNRIDNGLGIIDNSTNVPNTLMAPAVNLRAINSGLMDKVLMEGDDDIPTDVIEHLFAKSDGTQIMCEHDPEVVRNAMYSGF